MTVSGKRFGERFWLLRGGLWQEVDKAEYVAAERAAGFNNTMGQPDEPATTSFGGSRGQRGTTMNPFQAGPADGAAEVGPASMTADHPTPAEPRPLDLEKVRAYWADYSAKVLVADESNVSDLALIMAADRCAQQLPRLLAELARRDAALADLTRQRDEARAELDREAGLRAFAEGYLVEFPDGVTDFWAVDDPDEPYEFSNGVPVDTEEENRDAPMG